MEIKENVAPKKLNKAESIIAIKESHKKNIIGCGILLHIFSIVLKVEDIFEKLILIIIC